MGIKFPFPSKILNDNHDNDNHDHLVAAWVLPLCSTFQLWRIRQFIAISLGNETVTNCNPLKLKAEGGSVAKAARKQLESKLGRSVITKDKASDYLLPENDESQQEDK